jgi:hypothetical protein
MKILIGLLNLFTIWLIYSWVASRFWGTGASMSSAPAANDEDEGDGSVEQQEGDEEFLDRQRAAHYVDHYSSSDMHGHARHGAHGDYVDSDW